MKTLVSAVCTIFALIVLVNVSPAGESGYKLYIPDVKYISDNALEFDIYLTATGRGAGELRYSIGQYFLEFNPAIANGGKLTYSITNSDLPESMRPRNASVSGNLLRLACNAVSSDKSILPVISSTSPGTLIVKMRLETSAEKFSTESLDLKWTGETSIYRTKVFTFDGSRNIDITNEESHRSGITDGNGIAQNNAEIPKEYSLLQNYPNPFNPSTNLEFGIPNSQYVSLKIYDISGKEVATIINSILNPGTYKYLFDGSNLASGVYIYKIHAGNFTAFNKMLLLK